jgi:hypothetical protein
MLELRDLNKHTLISLKSDHALPGPLSSLLSRCFGFFSSSNKVSVKPSFLELFLLV